MKWLLWIGALGASAGASSGLPYDQVLQLIATAQKRVLLYAPQLTDLQMADALRIKALEGVPVVLITVPFFSYQPESTVSSLALAGIKVYEAQVNAKGSVLVIDDKTFNGQDFGRVHVQMVYLGSVPTNTAVQWFRDAADHGKNLTWIDAARRLGGLQK